MPQISYTHFQQIKQRTEQQFGSPIEYVKQCITLEYDILEKTKRAVSNSTLKRFFGLVNSKNNPSKYTLDTLAIYVGYENWEDFTNHDFDMERLLDSAQKNIEAINRKNLMLYQNHAVEFYFVLSEKLIAKQKLIVQKKQLTEIFGDEKNGRKIFVQQLIQQFQELNLHFLFIDLYSPDYNDLWKAGENTDIELIVPNELEKKLKNSNRHTFVLVELSKNDTKHSRTRQEVIYTALKKHFVNKKNWSLILASAYRLAPHLPPNNSIIVTEEDFEFSEIQIHQVLEQKVDDNLFLEILLAPCLKKRMKQPDFLNFFIENKTPQESLQTVLEQYIAAKSLSLNVPKPNPLINYYLYFTKYGSKNALVRKNDILNHRIADSELQKLLQSGFFKESISTNKQLSHNLALYIKEDWLYSYLSTMGWIQNNGISSAILEPLLFYYKHNPTFLVAMVQWFMFYAGNQNNTAFFSKILSKTYQFAYRTYEIQDKTAFFTAVLSGFFLALRKSENFRALVFNKLISSQNERKLFFENEIDVDFIHFQPISEWESYLSMEQTAEAKFRYHYFFALKHFLQTNQLKVDEHAKQIAQQKYLIASDIKIARRFFFIQIINQKHSNDDILLQVNTYFEKLENKIENEQKYDFYFRLAEGFALTQQWPACLKVVETLFEKLPEYLPKQTYKNYTLQLFFANALWHTNQTTMALETYARIPQTPEYPLFEENYRQIFNFLLKKTFSNVELSQQNHHYLKMAINLHFFHFKNQII